MRQLVALPRYLLDTNAVIALMKANPNVTRRVQEVGTAGLTLCAPVEAELWFGVARSDPLRQEHNRQRLLTLLSALPSLAFMGEATARTHDLILVTRNVREFERVPGLKLENWEAAA